MKVTWNSIAVVLGLSLLGSCGKSDVVARTYHMGEKVQVGPLIYTVLGAEWKTEIGDGLDRHIAKDRLLIIQLAVTNSGGADVGSPLTQVIDAQGKEYGELQEAKGLPQWLGLLRKLSPAATEQGRIVFDVPLGVYKLKVADGGDLENEKTALIEIPLELNAPPPSPAGLTLPPSK